MVKHLIMLFLHLQIGDLKGLFGLFMVQMQILRAKLKVLDASYGIGTGWSCHIKKLNQLVHLHLRKRLCDRHI